MRFRDRIGAEYTAVKEIFFGMTFFWT